MRPSQQYRFRVRVLKTAGLKAQRVCCAQRASDATNEAGEGGPDEDLLSIFAVGARTRGRLSVDGQPLAHSLSG